MFNIVLIWESKLSNLYEFSLYMYNALHMDDFCSMTIQTIQPSRHCNFPCLQLTKLIF